MYVVGRGRGGGCLSASSSSPVLAGRSTLLKLACFCLQLTFFANTVLLRPGVKECVVDVLLFGCRESNNCPTGEKKMQELLGVCTLFFNYALSL